MRTEIVYEDAAILVVHKPAGIATQTDRLGQADVVSELKNYLAKDGKSPYLGVIHRLDQPVEGLLVFAKTQDAAKKLSAQITNNTLKKQYYALVCGKPKENQGVLVDDLIKLPNNTSQVATPEMKKGPKKNLVKQAKLSWQICHTKEIVLDDGTKETYSLMDVTLFTGRHHQIRVQMSHAGMPLLGDVKYGDERSMQISKKLGISQTALFAYKVHFTHPLTRKELEFTLPVSALW